MKILCCDSKKEYHISWLPLSRAKENLDALILLVMKINHKRNYVSKDNSNEKNEVQTRFM